MYREQQVHNLTINNTHTYYVVAGESPVLTHNCPPHGGALGRGAAKVPSDWGVGMPNAKGVGTRWYDPLAPKANGVRIDAGNPNSAWPSQQVDHVVVRSEGRILGPDGTPLAGSLKDNPEAHIPLTDWVNWTTWNSP